MVTRPLVSIVDDDESVRESLPDLLQEFGFDVCAFASAEEFLASSSISQTRCLVLDVAMPGMSGPALQVERGRQCRATPILFTTANTDENIRPQLLAAGAVECLFKPFTESALLDAVTTA